MPSIHNDFKKKFCRRKNPPGYQPAAQGIMSIADLNSSPLSINFYAYYHFFIEEGVRGCSALE